LKYTYFLSNNLTSTTTANRPTNPEFPKDSIKAVTLPTTSIPNTAPPKSTCTKMPRVKNVNNNSVTPEKNVLLIQISFP